MVPRLCGSSLEWEPSCLPKTFEAFFLLSLGVYHFLSAMLLHDRCTAYPNTTLQRRLKWYRVSLKLILLLLFWMEAINLCILLAFNGDIPIFMHLHLALMGFTWLLEIGATFKDLDLNILPRKLTILILNICCIFDIAESIKKWTILKPDSSLAAKLTLSFTIAQLMIIMLNNLLSFFAWKMLGDQRHQIELPHEFIQKADFWRNFKKSLLYVWPRGDWKLLSLVFGSFMALLCGRVVNIVVPIQYKMVINYLGSIYETGNIDILPFVVFATLKLLQGSGGFLGNLQNFLWIKVGQYATKQISVQLFEHLHNLSLSFHVNRKTGEVLRVMDRGTESIVSLLSSFLFNILPTLVDIAVACFFFAFGFDVWFALVIFLTMAFYLIFTVLITEWRTRFRRELNELDMKLNAKAVDSLLNFETVKYFGAEKYEIGLYTAALDNLQKADIKSQTSLYFLNFVQSFVICIGIFIGSLLCAERISMGLLTVSDFVLFLAYVSQLYIPLNFFGTYYRMIQQNLIDMEKMFDLFNHIPEVEDSHNAQPLAVSNGDVVFENVTFAYNDVTAPSLNNLSIRIPGGSMVAFVGSSGAGKSTILRLLFRLYDVKKGRILIDNQDIRDITRTSLRRCIGVVPQDTILFNDTIKFNIEYGKVESTFSEISEAAKAARIHEKIENLPEGYETMVGERGLRLSGGEKQRVAIARALLKNPKILVLDEATSALDTQTERQIQESFKQLCLGRTTIIIAHRLSTIIHANLICVLEGGEIVEKGTHEELLAKKGIYSTLWYKQLAQGHD